MCVSDCGARVLEAGRRSEKSSAPGESGLLAVHRGVTIIGHEVEVSDLGSHPHPGGIGGRP